MFAVVESGNITSMPPGTTGLIVDGIKHPRTIFTLWTEAERNAIGVYTVIIDNTNKKSSEYFNNTDQTYTFDADANTVTASYGTASSIQLNDILYTQNEVDADTYEAPHAKAGERISGETWEKDDVKQSGLKTKYKNQFNLQAAGLLAKTDWHVVKATEVSGYSVPSAITTYRAAVRTKVNSMETAIDNCSDNAALETLLTYTTNESGVTSRPLGEFPDEVI
jgi:hypothetical protein